MYLRLDDIPATTAICLDFPITHQDGTQRVPQTTIVTEELRSDVAHQRDYYNYVPDPVHIPFNHFSLVNQIQVPSISAQQNYDGSVFEPLQFLDFDEKQYLEIFETYPQESQSSYDNELLFPPEQLTSAQFLHPVGTTWTSPQQVPTTHQDSTTLEASMSPTHPRFPRYHVLLTTKHYQETWK